MMQLREDLQRRDQQCAMQASARHYIQPHIDGLRREVCSHVVRTLASEASGSLCRREAPSRRVLTYPHSQGSTRSARGRSRVCAVQTRYVGPSRHCGHAHGSPCCKATPIPWPSPLTNGPVPGSGSHVLRHLCAYSMSLAWQHLSRSGA